MSVEAAGDRLQITVEDDGAGFDPSRAGDGPAENGGFGLHSLREQLASLGGRLDVCSAAGEGHRVVVAAPVGGRRRRRRDSG